MIKNILLWLIGISGAWWCLDGRARAEVGIAGRHVYILQPGENEIWGSYVFLVESTTDQAEEAVPLMLPQEKREFGPQEGMTSEELQFDEARGVVLKKKFNVGSNLFAVGFNVSASNGSAALTLSPGDDVQDISFMVPVGGLKVTGPNLNYQPKVNFIGREFDTYVYKADPSGPKVLQFSVIGIPEGRAEYWLVASSIGGALVLFGLFLAWRTLPKSVSGDSVYFEPESQRTA